MSAAPSPPPDGPPVVPAPPPPPASPRRRIGVTKEALRAIRRGEVDAIFLEGPGQPAVFSRQGAEAPYRLLIEEMQEGAATLGQDGLILYANRALSELTGVALPQLPGRPFPALLIPEHAHPFAELLDQLANRAHAHAELMVRRPDDTRLPVRLAACVLPGQTPAIIGLIAVDLTLFKHAEEQLRIAARVFDKTGEAIIVTDALTVIQTVNDAFTRTMGYAPGEIVGRPIRILNSGHHTAEFFGDMHRSLQESGYWQGEIWNRRRDGQIEPQWMSITAIHDEHGQVEHYVCVMSDMAKNRDSQRKIEYLATHDTLTRLPNRALFLDRLHQNLAQARRTRARLAVLFVDLDDFKKVNDTLGHDVGDGLLRAVATRLRAALRDIDTLARQGGDEFTIILNDCGPERADQIARRLVEELAHSMAVDGHEIFITASAGVALFPDDGDDPSELLRHADAAMYRAKEQGRNRVEFYRPELNDRLVKRAELESALRRALQTDALRLVYQPKIGLEPGRPLVGAEALLRWRDPVLGDVAPGDFVPVAEASGLIIPLAQQVQSMLLEQVARWRAAGLAVPKVAYNVSARSIRDPAFAEQLLGGLQRRGIPSAGIQVEITEGTLLDNTRQVIQTLQALSEGGITIAIDDFGTGYSSLAYLKRLPLTELKIDKGFVDGLGQEHDDEAIAAAVLGLAHALGLQVVAEGVETESQLDWLQRHNCDVAQGYFFARPLEQAAFEAWLRRTGAPQAPPR